MGDYGNGEKGAVESESLCMPSKEKRNVDSMNKAMGYNSMSDLANTKPFPAGMEAAKSNPQNGPKAASNNYNYDKNRG